MGKRITIGFLAMSVVALWGIDASATNRINGVLIKHRSPWEVVVTLQGVPAADTLITVAGTTTVEIICLNPNGHPTDPGQPHVQDVPVTTTARVTSADFDGTGHAEAALVFDLSSVECHQNNFQKVDNSELIVSLEIVTAWKQCNGKEPGPDGTQDGDPCFEFQGAVETVKPKPIEAVATTCGAGVRNPDGITVPAQDLEDVCVDEHHIGL